MPGVEVHEDGDHRQATHAGREVDEASRRRSRARELGQVPRLERPREVGNLHAEAFEEVERHDELGEQGQDEVVVVEGELAEAPQREDRVEGMGAATSRGMIGGEARDTEGARQDDLRDPREEGEQLGADEIARTGIEPAGHLPRIAEIPQDVDDQGLGARTVSGAPRACPR